MTARLPSSTTFCAVSTLAKAHHGSVRLTAVAFGLQRHYAKPSRRPQQHPRPGAVRNPVENALPKYNAKSALELIQGESPSDPINPPSSTLPPPLELPTRGPESVFVYWFRIGRTYAGFYKDGIKAVWFNYQASRLLRERIKEKGAKDITDAVQKELITRSDFQLLGRNRYDIGKLPIFGALVLVFGEWLVLVVPFIPSTVPGTSRIPKQVDQMRSKAEERRRVSFRHGVSEPDLTEFPETQELEKTLDLKNTWAVAFNKSYRSELVKPLRTDQLFHISSTLGLHNSLWDRVQLTPPAFLLRRAIDKRLGYLSLDDKLLIRCGGAARLSPAELQIACDERGLDILGKPDEVLRHSLSWWLMRQEEDDGKGRALLPMLFRRLAMREWVQLNMKANNPRQA